MRYLPHLLNHFYWRHYAKYMLSSPLAQRTQCAHFVQRTSVQTPITTFLRLSHSFFSRSPYLILLHWHRMSRDKKKLLKKWIVFFFRCNRFQFFIAFTMCYQSARVWNRNVITLLKIFFRIEQSFIGGEKHGTCWWHRYSSDEWKFYRWMRKCREKKARKRKNKIPLSSHNCSQWKVVKLYRQLIRFDWCLN